MSDMAIDLHDVAKTYKGKVQALRGIEMNVHRGEIFGLLGPNGAGKSTLVKILMTVIRASRCTGTMLGQPVGAKSALQNVGYLPEHHRFPAYLTGGQVLDYYGALSNVGRAERRKRADELLELVGMTEWRNKKVKGYSKGMRQRLGIANSLMNDPELVLLDEPTDGVDPVGRRDIREVLVRLKSEGKTVFLNSHLLSELEMVCDRVAILVQGQVSSLGTINELTHDDRRYILEIVSPAGKGTPAALVQVLGDLVVTEKAVGASGSPQRRLASGVLLEVGFERLAIQTDEPQAVQPLIDRLRSAGVLIKTVRAHRPSLEDLFMQAVTDPTSGAAYKPGAAT